MIRIDRVVTRGGDGGQTSLGDGTRVSKDDHRVAAYGTVDESNAVIGLLRVHVAGDREVDSALGRIQNDLFDIGADLCVPGLEKDRLRVTEQPCLRLEAEIITMNALLLPLNSFVLPGGTPAAAFAHQARAVVRRAERMVVALMQNETVNASVIHYLNRLSDYLFVLARRLNDNGAGDVEWVPGKNRQ